MNEKDRDINKIIKVKKSIQQLTTFLVSMSVAALIIIIWFWTYWRSGGGIILLILCIIWFIFSILIIKYTNRLFELLPI
jgi:membrane protein YdbS with pleckstrin-like domain